MRTGTTVPINAGKKREDMGLVRKKEMVRHG
jgi:hypothetical protein